MSMSSYEGRRDKREEDRRQSSSYEGRRDRRDEDRRRDERRRRDDDLLDRAADRVQSTREMVSYRGRGENDTPEIQDKIERLMEQMGCSEPVARNMLKCGKLGIAPVALGIEGEQKPQRPRDPDWEKGLNSQRASAASARADKKRKLLEQETRLREEAEQREEEELKTRKEKMQKRTGFLSLGPVLARPEQIDPLPPVAAAKEKPILSRERQKEEEEEEHPKDDLEDDKRKSQDGFDKEARRALAIAALEAEAARKKQERKKQKQQKKREGGGDSDSDKGSDEGNSYEHSRRVRSAFEERDEPSRSRGTSSGSLMTEAEVRAMMNKNKGSKHSGRGSIQAQKRIQKESEEWESRKNHNPEYFKAPQFCLCFSAETAKNRGY